MIEIEVINLDTRLDRWEDINSEFSEFKLNRFSAIRNEMGWVGCALSHLEIIKKSKYDNKEYVIVMEDDTIIIDDNFYFEFNEIINYLEKNINNWDIFNVCCTYSNQGTNTITMEDDKLGIVSYQFGKTTNFIIYNKSSYDSMLSLYEIYENPSIESEQAIDILMCKVGLRMMTRIPFLCVQKNGYSDITNKIVNYYEVYKQNERYLKNKILK